MDKSNQQASSRDSDLSWLAAALEGEGWFIFHVSDRRKQGRHIEINPQVAFGNTDWAFSQSCYEISKKWITGCHMSIRDRKVKPHHLKSYIVTWAGMKRCTALLEAIIPYMRSGKKRRAELLLEFIKSRLSRPEKTKPFTTHEIAILIELKRLNNPAKPIAKGTLEKLQRLQSEQYEKY